MSSLTIPGARIDEDHESIRIADRSPSHLSMPRYRRIWICCPSRTRVRRPSSTASRFVFAPVAWRAAVIKLSSISMLVLMMCTPCGKHTHHSGRGRHRPNPASKKSNELMAHTYSHLFGIAATGLRFFTVYGPWGRPDMALFLFTKAILEGQPVNVFNHGKMQRRLHLHRRHRRRRRASARPRAAAGSDVQY